MERRITQLADISGFYPMPDHAEGPDGDGHFVLWRRDAHGNTFLVDGFYGYMRRTGPELGAFQQEADVLYLGNVEVRQPGMYIGSAAVALAIQNALKLGFHVGRAHIVAPEMVGVFENLLGQNPASGTGLVVATYYLPDFATGHHELLPTMELPNAPPCVTAEQAIDILNRPENYENNDEDDLRGVIIDTVFFF